MRFDSCMLSTRSIFPLCHVNFNVFGRYTLNLGFEVSHFLVSLIIIFFL